MEIASLNLAANAVAAASSSPQSGLVTVGFGKRAAARLIDLIIHYGVVVVSVVVVMVVIGVVSAVTGAPAEPMLARIAEPSVLGYVLSFLGAVLYSAICEGLHGSTPGKYLLGLVVLRQDGRPCTYTQAVGRSLAFFVDALFFGIVAYVSMKDSPTSQRVGDRWCGTVVATRASAPAGSLRTPLRFFAVLALALFVDGVAMMVSAIA